MAAVRGPTHYGEKEKKREINNVERKRGRTRAKKKRREERKREREGERSRVVAGCGERERGGTVRDFEIILRDESDRFPLE